MEFTFDVNEVLPQEITRIEHNLIPPGFSGDRRKLWDVQSKLSDVVNVIGEASAAAQGLTKPITTADRLKNSEHSLYLLVDRRGTKGKGAVLGLLKMGRKGLYIFDREGQHHLLKPLCVLDFYVNEAYQRQGLGKKIFEHMLQEENIEPVCLAIDRPSEKFLGFLRKHYDLTGPIPQMNNFVVFDGFFAKQKEQAELSPNQHSSCDGNRNNISQASNETSTKSQNGYHVSPFGRYGAPRPICSMGQIIHNHSASVQPTEPSRW